MSDLYPTPTRLALLEQVKNGEMTYHPLFGSTWSRGHVRTSVARDLKSAGWIEVDPRWLGGAAKMAWRLTDTGRAVLAQHGGAS